MRKSINFLQTGHNNGDCSQDGGKRNERANHKTPNSIHVFNCDIVTLALDSTEQRVILSLDMDDIVLVVHGSCATDAGVRLSLSLSFL
jgi:hypothetical protein